MKKFTVILLSALLFFVLSACGVSEKAQEKAAEKVAEKAIENAIGGDVKVKIDGDKYTYEDKDGNKMAFGSTEWPTDKAAAFIPKLDKGTIISSSLVANMYLIDVEKVEQADYDSYLEEVKDAGFTEETLSMEGEGYKQYQAADINGNYIMISYEAEEKILKIMGTVAEKE